MGTCNGLENYYVIKNNKKMDKKELVKNIVNSFVPLL